MKRIFIILSILLLIAVGMSVLPRFAIRYGLHRIFPGSEVSIARIYFGPGLALNLSQLSVQRKPSYSFSVGSARFTVTLRSALRRTIERIELQDVSADTAGIQVKGVSLRIAGDNSPGEFTMAQLAYNKLKLNNVKGALRITKDALMVQDLHAQTLDGTLAGGISVGLTMPMKFDLHLTVEGLSLEAVVRDFDLGKRIQMRGFLEGHVAASGQGESLQSIEGDFKARAPGGELSLLDSGQPLEKVVESLKEYQYNSGVVHLGGKGRDLSVLILLDGQQGARDFEITVHDFLTNGGIQ